MNYRGQTNQTVIEKSSERFSFLILTGGVEKGGAERRIITLIKSLSREGFNVNIGAFSKKFRADQSKLPRISLTYLGTRGIMPLVPTLRILRLILSTQPDIVFSNLRRVNTIAMMAKILSFSNKRLFILGVSNNPNYHPNPLFTRLLYKHAGGLIANSRGTKNYLCKEWGLDSRNIHVIYNGVNSNQIISLKDDDSKLGWYKESFSIIIAIGRLSTQKNHACLIKAFSLVGKKIDSRLVVIGEGPLRQSLEGLAERLGVAEHTFFAGYQDNPYKFLARSAVFVLSSRWEGFPNVILEAMVCGVPVISTDVDFGPREIIDHGENGFLVPDNDPKNLAAQIQYVLENRKKAFIKEIINNAREKVRSEFTLEAMLKNYREFFLNVHNGHYAKFH